MFLKKIVVSSCVKVSSYRSSENGNINVMSSSSEMCNPETPQEQRQSFDHK